ncbi:FIG005121: SAM-dependent methyltransferase (EC [Kosakonia radicincitans]|nr:FIG005121: SAM-dependent methyltransferase (EC [Kosakonia radicincitans]
MKPARTPQTFVAPVSWNDLPKGAYYREALEGELKPWFAKMYGFHLLKIAISAQKSMPKVALFPIR